jgi:hypothetical protein
MVKLKPRPPRERAARALCALAGNPENMMFQGKPMWMSYLPEVDAVLEAVGWSVDVGSVKLRPQRSAIDM